MPVSKATFALAGLTAAVLAGAAFAMSRAPASVAAPLDASGTEPFWTIEIRDDGLTLSTPDKLETKFPAATATLEGERTTWTSTSTDGKMVTVTVWPGNCSDGMSDIEYPLTAVARTTADVDAANMDLNGCARTPGRATP